MAAYCRVYYPRHLQADRQYAGSAPEPYARQSSMGYVFFTYLTLQIEPGEPGAPGPQGVVGEQGASGPQGSAGVRGPAGSEGAPGVAGHAGQSAPAPVQRKPPPHQLLE